MPINLPLLNGEEELLVDKLGAMNNSKSPAIQELAPTVLSLYKTTKRLEGQHEHLADELADIRVKIINSIDTLLEGPFDAGDTVLSAIAGRLDHLTQRPHANN